MLIVSDSFWSFGSLCFFCSEGRQTKIWLHTFFGCKRPGRSSQMLVKVIAWLDEEHLFWLGTVVVDMTNQINRGWQCFIVINSAYTVTPYTAFFSAKLPTIGGLNPSKFQRIYWWRNFLKNSSSSWTLCSHSTRHVGTRNVHVMISRFTLWLCQNSYWKWPIYNIYSWFTH